MLIESFFKPCILVFIFHNHFYLTFPAGFKSIDIGVHLQDPSPYLVSSAFDTSSNLQFLDVSIGGTVNEMWDREALGFFLSDFFVKINSNKECTNI